MTTSSLHLLEPSDPGPAWAPFAGVRPVSELRAGVWKIRERWEAALDAATATIIGAPATELCEAEVPVVHSGVEVRGPAVIGAAWFAPTGAPIVVAPETRRLVHQGTTVGWVVPAGEQWDHPHERGAALEVEGLQLRGVSDLLTALERFLAPDCLGFAAGGSDPVPAGSIVLGDPGLVFSQGAMVEPGVVFDTRAGAIVLESGVEVRHGTRLEGPLFAGEHSRLLGDHLRASVIGPRCSVRGEVSTTVMLGYSNKSHGGFVGHSVLGHWVNLGAGTTTSNLKNTYGEVALEVAGQRLATGRQFVGSLIGDHAKTAIGTLLPTGAVIGAGANVFGSANAPKYVRPFAWGSDGGGLMSEEGFLRVAERVLPRREVTLTAERRAALIATYRRLTAG